MYITGERQKKLSEALDKAPPKAYLEAMAALLKWLQNNKDVLKSEKYEVKELAVMEKQYRQFKVGSVCLFCGFTSHSTAMVMSSWSVKLTTHFPGQA